MPRARVIRTPGASRPDRARAPFTWRASSRGGSDNPVQVELFQEGLTPGVLRGRGQAGRFVPGGDPLPGQRPGSWCRPGGAGRRRVPRGSRLPVPRGREPDRVIPAADQLDRPCHSPAGSATSGSNRPGCRFGWRAPASAGRMIWVLRRTLAVIRPGWRTSGASGMVSTKHRLAGGGDRAVVRLSWTSC